MKKVGVVVGMLLVFGVGTGADAAGTKVAFVDVQKILVRSVAGAAAREQLEREKVTMQKEVDNRRVEVEKLRDELEKKGQLLSADARRERQETLERKIRDVRRLVDDLQKELQKKEQELLAKVLHDVSGIIEKLGKDRGYYLIVEKRGAGVIYNSSDADLTDEVIRAFDREAPAKGKK